MFIPTLISALDKKQNKNKTVSFKCVMQTPDEKSKLSKAPLPVHLQP